MVSRSWSLRRARVQLGLQELEVQEARQLRELMATQVQSQLASQMKAEKESQMAEEAWRDTIKTDRIGRAKAKPDPF